MWGANAVNGVINIVTKSAQETQGGLLSLGVGTEERALTGLRYGDALGAHGHYRVYGKFDARDAGRYADGSRGDDSWRSGQGGFRADWDWGARDALTLQGDMYYSQPDTRFEVAYPYPPYHRRCKFHSEYYGGNLLVRWNRQLNDDASLQLQAYYDRSSHETIVLMEHRDTLDIEWQHNLSLGERHTLVWGGGYRYVHDHTRATRFIALRPGNDGLHLFNLFIQDTMMFYGDRLRLTAGVKLEHNDYTGVEIQPSIRLAWTPNEKHTVWGAVSRAVRTPNRMERDARIVNKTLPGTVVALNSNRGYDSEELIAYEIGYRLSPSARMEIDLTGYWHDYRELRTIELRRPFFDFKARPLRLNIPFEVANNACGEGHGFEAGIDWRAASWWRMRLAYTYSDIRLQARSRTITLLSNEPEGDTPAQQVYFRNSVDLPNHWEIDAVLRYVDRLPAFDVSDYLTMDVRVGWRPREHIEFALVGQNLLQPHHDEFRPTFVSTSPTAVQRGVYGKMTWRF